MVLNENKLNIINYFKNIYKFLGEKYCFISGAFVIEDNLENLLNLLKSVHNHSLKILGLTFAYTHNKYNKNNMETLNEIHIDDKKYDFVVKCKCLNSSEENLVERIIRNIKWYKFTQNQNKYIYVKLEDYPTFSLEHKKQAKQRYGIGKEATCLLTRREDCDKDEGKSSGEGCRYNKKISTEINKPFETPEKIIIDDSIYTITETYKRQGDEVFIPQVLNDYLMKNNNPTIKLDFEYNNENNSIIVKNFDAFVGGKRATRKRGTIRKRATRKHATSKKRTTRKK